MSCLQKHMSFTVDLNDAIITAISEKRLAQPESAAEVGYEFR